MLVVPKSARGNLGLTVDNWGTNPSNQPGTTVTPGTSGAEGSWTECISDTLVTEDLVALHITVMQATAATAPRNMFLDIGIDPAGGTSYVVLLENIVCGDPYSAAPAQQWFFPILIPAGSAIAARIRGVSATPGTQKVALRGWGRSSAPETMPVAQFSQTLGVTETTAVDATAFTPGNAADGTWASLGATSRDLWWWQLGYQIDNATITAEFTYIDLGYGDGTSGGTTTIHRLMHSGSTSEYVTPILGTWAIWPASYCPLPAGTTMYVRGRCNNAPDTGYQAGVVALGG
jgi:hypothetical protein